MPPSVEVLRERLSGRGSESEESLGKRLGKAKEEIANNHKFDVVILNDDFETVFAAVFDHKGETPGLGAEINRDFFQLPFKGKTIMEEGEFVSIKVQKGGAKGDIHKVDGISGGTITSDGVTDMIDERLSKYLPYFKGISPAMQVQEALEVVIEDELKDTVSNINERIID